MNMIIFPYNMLNEIVLQYVPKLSLFPRNIEPYKILPKTFNITTLMQTYESLKNIELVKLNNNTFMWVTN